KKTEERGSEEQFSGTGEGFGMSPNEEKIKGQNFDEMHEIHVY
ncbi:hypothetical protein AVEN_155184-1, partial [Araneus ventricosus]